MHLQELIMRHVIFSVIMPCYNAEATLAAAVASVCTQSLRDFELIIVDDGSQDGSITLARSLASEDRRITLICQRNAGPAAARNHGLARAQGDYIAFLDADDTWSEHTLALHLTHFKINALCGISFGRVQFYDAAMRYPGRVSPKIASLSLLDILGEYQICTTSNLVCRREVFGAAGSFDETLTHGEDQELCARVLARTPWQVKGIPQITVQYRTSPLGLSANLAKTTAGWAAMLQRVRGYAPQELDAAVPRATAIFYRYLARRALRTGQARASLAPLLTAWRASPMTLLTNAPQRTLMTTLGVAIAMLPGNPARELLAR